MRFTEDVHAALEAEARSTGKSKVGIVDEILRRRYRLRSAA